MLTLVVRVQLSDADFCSRLATPAVATSTARNFRDDRPELADSSPAKPVGFDRLTGSASNRQVLSIDLEVRPRLQLAEISDVTGATNVGGGVPPVV